MTDSPITAAIHQPNFLPWGGFFYKWLKSDILVFLDDVQFIRRGYSNRVKIKGPEGERWLTVPVIKKGRYLQRIDEVEIEREPDWKKKIGGSLHACYGKAPFFKDYFSAFEAIIEKDHTHLASMNIELLVWLSRQLGIETKTVLASRLPGITGQSTQRLVSLCRAVGATQYLSGFGGQKYQDDEIFRGNGIGLAVYDFTPPVYPQLWGEFIPGLSILDLLFNTGPRSKTLLSVPCQP
jgi:hypothetical protein